MRTVHPLVYRFRWLMWVPWAVLLVFYICYVLSPLGIANGWWEPNGLLLYTVVRDGHELQGLQRMLGLIPAVEPAWNFGSSAESVGEVMI